MGASYLVGTPKGRLTKLEKAFVEQPWATVREGVQVKQLATKEDVYVLAHSEARIDKERAMRRKRLRRYVNRLQELQGQTLTRDALLMKVGAARQAAGRAARLVQVLIPQSSVKASKARAKKPTTAAAKAASQEVASLQFKLDRAKLREVRRREGRYLLRTNLDAQQPERLWTFYIQLTEVEQAFKELKGDLAVRPIFHKTDERVEAHIFVAFLAYCLQVTLKGNLRPLAGGLTPREAITKFKTIQMVDVLIPTTDGRQLLLSRYTQPEAEHRMLLQQLRLSLPEQPPPKISANHAHKHARRPVPV